MDLTQLEKLIGAELPLVYVADSESTMRDAKNYPAPVLIVADNQIGAHGRFKRAFFTQKNHGIYLSLKINGVDRTDPSFPPLYTEVAAVALCEAIERLTPLRPGIKWVNDLYLNGKKIAGILTQAQFLAGADRVETVTLGLGLNFDIAQKDFPIDLQDKVTSLFGEIPPTITKEELIAEFVARFFINLKKATPSVLTAYKKRLFFWGGPVSFEQNGQLLAGTAIDIAADGSLVVKLADGTVQQLHSGEISLKKF